MLCSRVPGVKTIQDGDMDPVSQGALGAALAQSGGNRRVLKAATFLGCLGGLAPDLDIFIFSPSDPLLFLEYHRQFTHSLVFIPIGALLVALATHRLARRMLSLPKLSFREAYLFCLLGYATHALLDACTSYGTQLLWPFSFERFAWNNVSIVDPLFTLPVLGLVIISVYRRQAWFGRLAFGWAMLYLMMGIVQRDRAIEAGYELASSRGHVPIRLEAKPGFGNLLLWKVVYETQDYFYVDGVRVGTKSATFPGDQVLKLNMGRHFNWLDPGSQQAKDIERFRWFSNNYLALDPANPNRIIDVRYSVVPNEVKALWAIDIDRKKTHDAHINWVVLRSTDRTQVDRWWSMLTE